jgi:acetoacetyl-CoA synthetase
VPIKKLLQGHPPEQVLKRDALAQPESVDWFVRGYLARGQGVGQT